MGDARIGGDLKTDELDPGAYIGHEPEREADSIPGGIKPGDERVSAYNSRPGVEGEPDDTTDSRQGAEGEPTNTMDAQPIRAEQD